MCSSFTGVLRVAGAGETMKAVEEKFGGVSHYKDFGSDLKDRDPRCGFEYGLTLTASV